MEEITKYKVKVLRRFNIQGVWIRVEKGNANYFAVLVKAPSFGDSFSFIDNEWSSSRRKLFIKIRRDLFVRLNPEILEVERRLKGGK